MQQTNRYFELEIEGQRIRIEATCQAGARGEIWLHERQADAFFGALQNARPLPYVLWACSPFPGSAAVTLVREEGRDGQLLIAIEEGPSAGSLTLGEPSQEALQLADLVALERQVRDEFRLLTRSPAARARGEEHVRALKALGLQSFVPADGHCYRCDTDVTRDTNATAAELEGMTGCPVCCVSWCD